MNDATKELIAKAACGSMESMGFFSYATSDGENDPDVTVWPFPLRPEGDEDKLVFAQDFRFDFIDFQEKLEHIIEQKIQDRLVITYTWESLEIEVWAKDPAEESLWVSILREPPDEVQPHGTLMKNGSVVFDKDVPDGMEN